MKRRNPRSRSAPGKKSRSVTALAVDSASACSWRRSEAAPRLEGLADPRPLRPGQLHDGREFDQLLDVQLGSQRGQRGPR